MKKLYLYFLFVLSLLIVQRNDLFFMDVENFEVDPYSIADSYLAEKINLNPLLVQANYDNQIEGLFEEQPENSNSIQKQQPMDPENDYYFDCCLSKLDYDATYNYEMKNLLEVQAEKDNKHSKEQTYKCSFCDENFIYPRYLNSHVLSFHKNKIRTYYICEYCKKEFYDLQFLISHLSFSTTVCSKNYTTGNSMEACANHYRVVDKELYTRKEYDLKNKTVHTCYFCNQLFFHKGKLNSHIFSKHQCEIKKEEICICQYCEVKFYNDKFLENHLNSISRCGRKHKTKKR
jgi:hypothetical protein